MATKQVVRVVAVVVAMLLAQERVRSLQGGWHRELLLATRSPLTFHSLSDRSPYGGPGGAASARPQKSDRRNMLVADKAIPRSRDIDNSELYDPYKTR